MLNAERNSGFARDIRDPKLLGEKLLFEVESVRSTYGEEIPLSEIWDVHVGKLSHPDFKGEMLGFYTAKIYREELEARDDKYAASTLERIARSTEHTK